MGSVSGNDDFKRRRQEGLWHSLNRLVIALIGFAVVIVMVCAFLPELKAVREQADRVDELKARIEVERTLLARRTRQVELLKNDREYVEMIARDRLDVMREGETIYRLETAAATAR